MLPANQPDPLAEAARTQGLVRTRSGPEASLEHPIRVLIAEDDPFVMDAVTLMLRHLGHIPTRAVNGERAMEALQSGEFDVLLADQRMGGMSGLELARRAKEIRPALPIVLMTGNVPVDIGPEIVMVLRKPFLVEELRAMILACARLARHGRFVLVTAHGDLFSIQSRLHNALVERRAVVNEAARALNMELNERIQVQIIAPDWVRTDLKARGFEI